jgi:hypothetical protein
MKIITYTLLTVAIFIYANVLIMSRDPCTAFAAHPERCSSDAMGE